MFGSAVFFAPAPHPDATYELDPVNRYVCRSGSWYREAYVETRERNSKLGAILRAVDQRLRNAIGYEHPLVEKDVPKYLAQIIDGQIEARLAWEHQREARMVRVDLSQLEGIRAAASVTREALLVDEEREDAPSAPSAPATAAVAANPTPDHNLAQPQAAATSVPVASTAPGPNEPSSALGLTDEEAALVAVLLQDKPAPTAATSLDMLVDSINEKLFDLLGDTAIEFGENGPAIIEDYQQDVRGALLP